jgi:hypothetical protein
MTVTVLSEDEYDSQAYDAVLIQERTAVCVDAGDNRVRAIPLAKVNHVDAPERTFVTGTELPEWFYGGGRYGFVEAETFDEFERHREDLERETAD